VQPISGSSESILNALKSPTQTLRESALLSLANTPSMPLESSASAALVALITPEIRQLLLEMILFEDETDMKSLSLGILRNYLQDVYEAEHLLQQDNSASLLESFEWNKLLDHLSKMDCTKNEPLCIEWMRLIRVICCIDLHTIKSVNETSHQKFNALLEKVASIAMNEAHRGTVIGGAGASHIWESIYIFFVWTDQNADACRVMQSNVKLVQQLQSFIKDLMPPQRMSKRMVFEKIVDENAEETMDDEQQQNEKQQKTEDKNYPSYLRIISLGVLYNIHSALDKNQTETLAFISQTFDHIALTLSQLSPAQHLDDLVQFLSKEHLNHTEAEAIKEDWRLPIEGQKLSLELLANMISAVAYDIQSPPVSYHKQIQDESSVSSHFYNFVSQKHIFTHLFAYLSSIMQSYAQRTQDKLDFVTDQSNLIHETLVSALGCMNNLILATSQQQLKPHESTFQSLFSGICAYMKGNLPTETIIKSALLEAATLILWSMLRKMDELDMSNEEATLASSLATFEESAVVRRNSVGILHEIGCRDLTVEQNQTLAEVLLAKLSDKDVMVAVESLNALFEIFGDDMFNATVKKVNMIARLEIFAKQVFAQKYGKQVQSELDNDDKEMVQEAQENLTGFIAYKRQHMK